MNEKIVNWLSIAGILGITGIVYKYKLFSDTQLQAIVVFLLIIGIMYRIYTFRLACKTVKERRRMYKELWKRGDKDTAPDLKKEEEESVVLLGRIRGGKFMTVLLIIIIIIALIYQKNMFALILSLGQIFLSARIYVITRQIGRLLLSDGNKDFPQIDIPPSASDSYLVEIDIKKVHDFIEPVSALPFWNLLETEQWLQQCGFTRFNQRYWKTGKQGLKFLDSNEIISIEPFQEE